MLEEIGLGIAYLTSFGLLSMQKIYGENIDDFIGWKLTIKTHKKIYKRMHRDLLTAINDLIYDLERSENELSVVK